MATLVVRERIFAHCKRTGEVYVERDETRAIMVEKFAGGEAMVSVGAKRTYSQQARDGLWRGGECFVNVYLHCPQTDEGVRGAMALCEEYAEVRISERYAELEHEINARVSSDRDALPSRR